MCPKPSPSSEANSSYPCGNASSHAVPENDQPGPSTAIPHLPTVESHESADDTYREMQDEGNSCVSGRRKRRPRSELIQCTVGGKKYGSSSALSQHKKKTHK